MEYFILALTLEIPRVIGFLIALFIGIWVGRYYIQHGSGVIASFLLASWVFFILDFLSFLAWRPEWSLLVAAASGATYYYYLVFVPKIVGVVILYVVISRRKVIQPTSPVTPFAFLKVAPLLAIMAIGAIGFSLYAIYSTHQLAVDTKARIQQEWGMNATQNQVP